MTTEDLIHLMGRALYDGFHTGFCPGEKRCVECEQYRRALWEYGKVYGQPSPGALLTKGHARGGAPDLHLHDGPLICKVCATPVSGEGVTEDAGATWMHLRCFKPQPGGAGFKCCGAGDPPCTSFEVSCQNPANYADGERWCPKCKQPDFPFCATSGCLKVPKLAEPPQPGGTENGR
jgi:hypothetical protein